MSNISYHFISGVLLLNAVLTVKQSCANSHKGQGWENITDAVIQYLNKNLSGVVFMLWGSYAQKKGAHINQVTYQAFSAARTLSTCHYKQEKSFSL